MESRLSPRNLTCPVCLRKLRRLGRVGKPDKCEHWFCFPCIHEWSKNVNTCPVDRIKFNYIELYSEANGPLIEKVFIPDCSLFQSTNEANDITYCEVCHECNREDRLLLCDGCDKGYHLECLTPPLDDVPTGNWYCIECIPIINSQYLMDCFSESEQDLSLSLDTAPTTAYDSDSNSDLITETRISNDCESGFNSDSIIGQGSDYESSSDVVITGMSHMQDSDSDVCGIGMRPQRQHSRRHRIIMIEESTSELSVTGESSDEEILATKLRRALQREASRASRIPLIRESSTTSSTCSGRSKFELDEGTTVLVTQENDRDNSYIDVVGTCSDTDCDAISNNNNDDYIEIDSIVCASAKGDGDECVRNDKDMVGTRSSMVQDDSDGRCTGNVCKTDSSNQKRKYSDQMPSSSKTKDKESSSSSTSRIGSVSKRRLVFDDNDKSNKHQLYGSPKAESKGRSSYRDRFDHRDDKISERGKEAVSKSRRELECKKRLRYNHGSSEEKMHHIASSHKFDRSSSTKSATLSETKPNIGKQKSANTRSVVNDDNSSCQSGYVEESPGPTEAVSTNHIKAGSTDQIKQERVSTSVDKLRREVGGVCREDILTRKREHTTSNNDKRHPTVSLQDDKSTNKRENWKRQSPERTVHPRRRKYRKVVLNPPKNRRSSKRWSPPPANRPAKRKRRRNYRRQRRKAPPSIFSGRRNTDSTYYPPRNISLDDSGSEWTPRTSRALARTAATNHSAMREAVRASYRYDSQEVGLKYARKILAQQRRGTTPWKSVLSLSPSQPGTVSTPLSGYSDRTLTPHSIGASCTPLSSVTPTRLHQGGHCPLNQYENRPGCLSLFLSREASGSRESIRPSESGSCEHRTKSDYHGGGWSDHTPQLPASPPFNRSKSFQDHVMLRNNEEEDRKRYDSDNPRRIVHMDVSSRRKRHLSEVLVTPIKFPIRENSTVDLDHGRGQADLLSQLYQNLDDLQNEKNIIQRDGSIVPIRDEEQSDMFKHGYSMHSDELSRDREHTPFSDVYCVPADSTTTENNHINFQEQQVNYYNKEDHHHHQDYSRHCSLQNGHQDVDTNAYITTQHQLQEETNFMDDFEKDEILKVDPLSSTIHSRLAEHADDVTVTKGDAPPNPNEDPKTVVKYCLDRFYKDGAINGHQYKRIFERSVRKVTKGTKVGGRIDVERVNKLVKDFVDAYTTAVPPPPPMHT